MTEIKVAPTYYTITDLYKTVNGGSRAMRGLFGYMMKTGRLNDVIFGGAVHLLGDLEKLDKNEVYQVTYDSACPVPEIQDISELVKAARAGAFKPYEIPQRDISKTLSAVSKLNLNF